MNKGTVAGNTRKVRKEGGNKTKKTSREKKQM
jgi:hypothetical protein